MATITKFEELEIWQMAREQAKDIFWLTQNGSFTKDFELKDQINRSAGSVMDNIAEGFDRHTAKDFSHFLAISKGSNAELRSQLYRAFDRQHIDEAILTSRLSTSETIGNKTMAFIKYLYQSQFKTKPLSAKE
ncbi:four helix bundle protein [Flavisolibacter ginsenosidimutans]|uniref:Four helix bundle protein n=1 Tax=Flavisolibacter ginsenosidimutans TaxID=661481 RepID=A0A5B8UMG1_9BACT|nr:four helix bundle protein [Flavisolibacter ginsenosidimutans]QEC57636.1 four helix bundle protein [Flavisolibacter ginsenosidimutans]